MKFKEWILLICISLPLLTSAQNDFTEGTIVLKSGDTLSVLIRKVTGRIAPRIVQYKSTASPEIKLLSAAEVKWFRYNEGEWYVGYTGPLENSSLNNNELTYDSLMNSVIDTIFIRAVVISKASLFYARDRNDRRHLFYSIDGSSITELLYKKYYVNARIAGNYQIQISRRDIMAYQLYKAQLMKAFKDCPYVASGILSRVLNYSKNDLLKLFQEYNHCKDATIVFMEEKDQGKAEFSPVAGINQTGVTIRSSYPPWTTIQFDRSFGFQMGMGFNWLLPRLGNKVSLYNEAHLKEHSLKGIAGSSGSETVSLKAWYAKLITCGRYQLPDKKIQPFFEIGISNGIALSHIDSTSGGIGASMFRDYRRYEQGIILGAGMKLKKFSGEFRVEKSNGYSPYQTLKTTFTTWYLMFGYTL